MRHISNFLNLPKKTLLFIVFSIVVVGGLTWFSLTKSSQASFDTTGANEITQKAGKFAEDGDYKSAYQLLQQAEEKKVLDESGANLYVTVKSTLYSQYLTAGMQSEEEQNFGQALKHYEAAAYVATSEAELAEGNQKVEQTKGLLKEQEQLREDFKAYTTGMQEVILSSNSLLDQYKTNLDKLSTGAIKPDALIQIAKQTVIENDLLISKLDENLFVQNDTLLEVHKAFISHMNSQHNMFLTTINLSAEDWTRDLSVLRGIYLEIKTEQVSLIQQVNAFSDTNNLGLKLESPKNQIIQDSNDSSDKVEEKSNGEESDTDKKSD